MRSKSGDPELTRTTGRASEKLQGKHARPSFSLLGGRPRGWPPFFFPQLRSAPPDSQAWLRESSIGTLKRSHNPKFVPLAGKVCNKCV